MCITTPGTLAKVQMLVSLEGPRSRLSNKPAALLVRRPFRVARSQMVSLREILGTAEGFSSLTFFKCGKH